MSRLPLSASNLMRHTPPTAIIWRWRNEPSCHGADVELRRPGPDGPYDLVQASFKSEDGLDFTVFVQPQNNPPETWDKLGYPRQFLEAGITRDAFEKLARAIVKGKTVLVWNAEHEKSYLPFLTELSVDGRPICDVQDLMWWASPLVTKEWSWKYGTWKFAKMTAPQKNSD